MLEPNGYRNQSNGGPLKNVGYRCILSHGTTIPLDRPWFANNCPMKESYEPSMGLKLSLIAPKLSGGPVKPTFQKVHDSNWH